MIDFPRLWTVFWPILLTFIGGRLVLQTDLIMVSRLGQSATAAFGIPLRIMLLDTILAFALAPVVSVLVAERREPGERAWVVRQALSLAAILGLALVGAGLLVYPYVVRLVTSDESVVRLAQGAVFWLTLAIPLRLVDFVGGMSLHGLGRGRRVLPVKLTEIVINAVLNWLLVYKLGFGFSGCYMGTLIASAVSVAWVLSILRSEIGPGPMFAAPDAAWARSTMSKAAAEFGRLLSEKTVAFLTLWIFASGQGGVARLSAFSVAMEFQMLVFMPMIALMRATAISLSAEGSKTDLGGLYRSIRGVAVPGAAACAAAGAIIGVFGGRIGWHLYRLDPAAMAWWIPMTAAFAVWLPMRFLDALQRGAWQSKKLFKEITVRETAVGWIFLLPCLFLAVRAQNPWMAWCTLLAGESLVALLLLFAARPGLRAVAAAALLLAAACLPASADEGMWPLDGLPGNLLKERYGFSPSASWVERLRLSSVRFTDGSGAFVSPDGLVLTNHHVAISQLQKLSTGGLDYVKNGFLAAAREDELPCPDLILNRLVSIEDVTARVRAAESAEVAPAAQDRSRKAEMARIEKESADRTGLRSDVVEFHQGAEYRLYRYETFKDVRLVMAPEQQAAFFGGDSDNFVYPRHALEIAFFRVYEGGRPYRSTQFLRWSADGAREGEMLVVSGHPWTTQRGKTLRQLRFQRDYWLPARISTQSRRVAALERYAGGDAERARRSRALLFGFRNALKLSTGELRSLENPEVMAAKESEEKRLREIVSSSSPLRAVAGGSWERISRVQNALEARHSQLARRNLFGASLADAAVMIVRSADEAAKPNEARLPEFRDSALEALRRRLASPAPVYADLEEAMLADCLRESLEELGPRDPYVAAALGGMSPEAKASALIAGTSLIDPARRAALVSGGKDAVAVSDDPLIAWAKGLDAEYRRLRRWHDAEIASVEVREGAKIARARFGALGASGYPDANFTLRLSFGRALGYSDGASLVPYKTTFHGLLSRSESFDGKPPFDLPQKVTLAVGLRLATPLNFVATNDIVGGNSGSPVVNREGELVGLVFDGNIQSLAWRYEYSDAQARSIAVHSRGIIEALRAVYGAGRLVSELTGRE